MSQTRKTFMPALVAASALLAMPAAFAANDAMMELLKVLKEKGTLDDASYEALVNAAKADDEHVKFAEDEVKRAQKENPVIDTKGKLEITSADKDFKWRIGGRLHADMTIPDNDAGALRSTNYEDKYEFRRMRLDVTAQVWKAWQLKAQYDFTDTGIAGLRDAFIKYLIDTDNVKGSVTTGHYKEYIALEELTSSNDISFIERSLPAAAFDATNGRRLGVGASLAFYDKVTTSLGLFGRSAGVATDDSVKLTGRVTYSPLHNKVRAIHVGAGGSYITNFDNNQFSTNPRPEFDVGGGVRPYGQIDATTSPAFSVANADDGWRFGGEAAVVWGPWSAQGEYQILNINRRTGEDLTFDGWYLMGSYLLTGESRQYKFEDGIFQNPKPSGVFGKGGWGAWELLVRYSNLDLFDTDLATCNLATAANNCGEEDNLTAGINWYPNQNLKFMANWIQVLDFEGGRFDGMEPSAFALRAQAYF
jgi:phosphate-selective porin OprO and OprP